MDSGGDSFAKSWLVGWMWLAGQKIVHVLVIYAS